MDITNYLNKKYISSSSNEVDAKFINFEMMGENQSSSLKLEIEGKILYHEFKGDNLLFMILLEYGNRSKLWDIKIYYNGACPRFQVFLNTSEIKNQPFVSTALQYFASYYILYLAEYDCGSIQSYLAPDVSLNENDGGVRLLMNDDFPLFAYQKNAVKYMIKIEKDKFMDIDLNYYLSLPDDDSLAITPTGDIWCPGKKKIMKHKLMVRGGILSDEMGLGKTITCLKLIQYKPREDMERDIEVVSKSFDWGYRIRLLKSKATVIVCPSHLTQQWLNQCKYIFNNTGITNTGSGRKKLLFLVSKPSFQKVSYYDLITSDIIIISQQFLMNCNYYLRIRICPDWAERKIKSLNHINDSNDFMRRMKLIHEKFPLTEFQISFLKSMNSIEDEQSENVKNLKYFQLKDHLKRLLEPNLEHFEFHRLILDEGHEIFGLRLQNTCQAEFLNKFLCNLSSKHRWYVSGTPFVSIEAVNNTLKFLDIRLYNEDEYENSFSDGNSLSKFLQPKPQLNSSETLKNIGMKIGRKSYFIENIMKKIMIRHRKKDVEDQIQIPDYEEEIIWVTLSSIEQQIYNNFVRTRESDINLQKLCCHIFLTHKNYNASHENVDLASVKEELIAFHSKNLEKYIKKREKIKIRITTQTNNISTTMTPQQIQERQDNSVELKNTEEKISEAKYMIQTLNKYSCFENSLEDENDTQEEECCICLDTCQEPILTKCGHKFCKFCITENLKINSKCPICKVYLKDNQERVRFIELGSSSSDEKKTGSLEEKYGSKLGMLILKLKELVKTKDNRIIIFSQWDGMLQIIGKTLKENFISNVFVKGNVHCRNSAISKFHKGVDTQVIMLSLQNAASGTNLNNATHIIFVEPINVAKDILTSIEKQALGRACRLGQKNKVKILRIMTKNTIEENIFVDKYLPQSWKNKENESPGSIYNYHSGHV